MTAKEKANLLLSSFTFSEIYFVDGEKGAFKNAKYCAINCVLQMLEVIDSKDFHTRGFYKDVKLELEKL